MMQALGIGRAHTFWDMAIRVAIVLDIGHSHIIPTTLTVNHAPMHRQKCIGGTCFCVRFARWRELCEDLRVLIGRWLWCSCLARGTFA